MKKMCICVLTSVLSVFAARSPFSLVRTVEKDASGNPSEEAIDLSICLETTPAASGSSSNAAKDKYESIIKYWADGIYEMSNGGNYLGNVRIYSGGSFGRSCDVLWSKNNVWPQAHISGFSRSNLHLFVSDVWAQPQAYDYRATDRRRFEFGMTLAHESMHYVYGLYDEYGTVSFGHGTSGLLELSANPQTDMVNVRASNYTALASQMDGLISGQPVYFYSNGGTIPSGLNTAPTSSYVWNNNLYYTIDDVIWAQDGSPSVSFSLKDGNGKAVDIKSSGSGKWGISLPEEGGSTAHTISNTQWPLASFKYGDCGANAQIPWQWANLSTSFNLNPNSRQATYYKEGNGKSYAGWDVVVRNPVNDVLLKGLDGFDRYWFKSLVNRAPTGNDVYSTKTHYMNYDEGTGTWAAGDATWEFYGYCKTKDIRLPYMKVELAGKSEATYSKQTRKHLKIEWMENPKVELIVVLDRSGSMSSYNKMAQAKLAADYVATAYLGSTSGYAAKNVRVGVYSFNNKVAESYAPRFNPNESAVSNAIKAVTASGSTALFDAMDYGLKAFTSDGSSQKIMYVISDGLDNASTKTAQDVINAFKSSNVQIHTFAYGADADTKLLASFASATGGTFYDQLSNVALDINGAAASVLAGSPGIEQVAIAELAASAQSSAFFVPKKSSRLRIYGSYSGSAVSSPIKILSGSTAVSYKVKSITVGNLNYFIADVDSAALSKVSTTALKVKNNVSGQKLEFRSLVSEKTSAYVMNASMGPNDYYKWPSQGTFSASVSGSKGLLTGVSASGKLIYPDGTSKTFTLYDDGSHGDNLAGDGVYHGYMPDVKKNGSYRWQVSVSNKSKKAKTTRVGISLPDTMAFTATTDTNPFEYYRNGQFVVNTCCSDANEDNTIQPEVYSEAYLQSGSDVDKFTIVGTKSDKSYALILKSLDLSSFDKVEVFAPSDLNTPLYSVKVATGSESFTISLSADLAVPGNIVSVSGKKSSGVAYSLLMLETDTAPLSVGRFEKASDWHSSNSAITLDGDVKSEGMTSLAVNAGWKTVESRNVPTSEIKLVGDKMSLDVYVPSSSVNQYWLGTIELWVSIPSTYKRIQIGSATNIEPTFNTWMTYEFAVPAEVKKLLAESHPDVRFQLVLNSADKIWVDNLRFSGNIVKNPVNDYDLNCPGAAGCSESNPIRVSVNGTVNVKASGSVWVEIVDIPTAWNPAALKISVFAADGEKLSSSITYSGKTETMNDWTYNKTVSYTRGNRYRFKLNNVNGRTYGVSAWATEQTVNLAYSQNPSDWALVF